MHLPPGVKYFSQHQRSVDIQLSCDLLHVETLPYDHSFDVQNPDPVLAQAYPIKTE